jgi:hypothetical protein
MKPTAASEKTAPSAPKDALMQTKNPVTVPLCPSQITKDCPRIENRPPLAEAGN